MTPWNGEKVSQGDVAGSSCLFYLASGWSFGAAPDQGLGLFFFFFWNPYSYIPQNPAGSASLAAPRLENGTFCSPPCEILILFPLIFKASPSSPIKNPQGRTLEDQENTRKKKKPKKQNNKQWCLHPSHSPLTLFPWIFSPGNAAPGESSVPFPGQPLDGNSSLDYGWKNHPGEERRGLQGSGRAACRYWKGFIAWFGVLQFMLVKLWDFLGIFKMLFACGNNAEGPGDPLDRSPPKLSCPFCPQTQLRVRVWGIWGGF